MSEVGFDIPDVDPTETETAPVEDELGLSTPEPEEVVVEERPGAEQSAADSDSGSDEEERDVEDAPQQESRAQKRIRQEIDRRKEIETRLQQSQAQIDEQRAQLQTLIQRLTPQEQAQQEQVPEFDEDPAAHLLHKQNQIQQTLEQQQNFLRQSAEQQQQAAQLQQVQQRYESMEEGFAREHPDYYDRIEGLKQQRLEVWKNLGVPDDQAMQQVQQEAWTLVMQGLQSGRNPAEVFYQMAQGVPGPAPNAVEQVSQAAERQQQAQSLGSRGGSKQRYTVADLASMDASEFDKVTAGDNWEKLVKSLGGA